MSEFVECLDIANYESGRSRFVTPRRRTAQCENGAETRLGKRSGPHGREEPLRLGTCSKSTRSARKLEEQESGRVVNPRGSSPSSRHARFFEPRVEGSLHDRGQLLHNVSAAWSWSISIPNDQPHGAHRVARPVCSNERSDPAQKHGTDRGRAVEKSAASEKGAQRPSRAQHAAVARMEFARSKPAGNALILLLFRLGVRGSDLPDDLAANARSLFGVASIPCHPVAAFMGGWEAKPRGGIWPTDCREISTFRLVIAALAITLSQWAANGSIKITLANGTCSAASRPHSRHSFREL